MKLGTVRDLIGALALPFVRGSSSVVVQNGQITKFNHPTWFVRLTHFVFLGRLWHPYEQRERLEFAQRLRQIASLVLEAEGFGEGRVTPVIKIANDPERGLGIVAWFVTGDIPQLSPENRIFFERVVTVFTVAGLPTWQINVRFNPRAWTNAIESPNGGGLTIIDLESQIVSPFVPWPEWQTAWRNGHAVPFDEVDFDRLWTFVHQVEGQAWPKASALRRAVGEAQATFRYLRQTGRW